MLKIIGLESIVKILTLILGFIQVPLLIDVLGKNDYGFWVVIFSLMQWITLVDLGVGNGLRNILPKLIHSERTEEVNTYLSTALVMLGGVMLLGLVSALTLMENISPSIFGFKSSHPNWFYDILRLFICVFFGYLLLTLVKPIAFVLHKPYLVSLTNLTASASVFAGTLFYAYSPDDSGNVIRSLLIAYILSHSVVAISISLVLYNSNKRLFSGAFKFCSQASREILKGSLNIFVLQLVAVLSYSLDNFLIASRFDAASVTEYSTVVKLFALYPFIVGIFISPLWNKASELLHLRKTTQLQKLVLFYLKLYLVSVPLVISSVYLAPPIFDFWVGKNLVNLDLLPFALFYLIMGLGMVVSAVLNAMSIISLQWKFGLVSAVLKVLLFLYFLPELVSDLTPAGLMWLGFVLCVPVTIYMLWVMWSYLATTSDNGNKNES